jgi:adenosylhomocysteine nucleosidase
LNGLGVVAALTAESRPLGAVRRGPQRDAPAALADGTLLMVSGVGCAAAARGARRLVDAGARALLSWGVAGGLDPALRAGALFLPGEVVLSDGAVYATTHEWRLALATAAASCHPVTGGRLLSLSEVLGSVADKAIAFRRTGAAAVDMESGAIAEVARAAQLPFLVVRAIADTAGDALPRTVVAIAGSGAVRIPRLLAALARAPGDLPALLRLARSFRAASRSLAAVARAGALAPP